MCDHRCVGSECGAKGRAAAPNTESVLQEAQSWKTVDAVKRRLKGLNLTEEDWQAAVYSGQTSKIMGIAVATTRISSGKPMRQ